VCCVKITRHLRAAVVHGKLFYRKQKMAFQTPSTSIRSSCIWFHQSGCFQKIEDTHIFQTVIKVTSKNNLIENSVLFHKNYSSRFAICVDRPSILLRLIKTRILSPTVLNFIEIGVTLLERYAAVTTRVDPPIAKFLTSSGTPSSPFKAMVPISSVTDLFHSFPRLISVPL